jgi:hypothetical protein
VLKWIAFHPWWHFIVELVTIPLFFHQPCVFFIINILTRLSGDVSVISCASLMSPKNHSTYGNGSCPSTLLLVTKIFINASIWVYAL